MAILDLEQFVEAASAQNVHIARGIAIHPASAQAERFKTQKSATSQNREVRAIGAILSGNLAPIVNMLNRAIAQKDHTPVICEKALEPALTAWMERIGHAFAMATFRDGNIVAAYLGHGGSAHELLTSAQSMRDLRRIDLKGFITDGSGVANPISIRLQPGDLQNMRQIGNEREQHRGR